MLLAACLSLAPPAPPASFPSPALTSTPHSLHLILDEQTGIAGFPSHIPACRLAAARFLSVLTSHRFTVHPNAYSNYPITIASVSSALNGTLLPSSRHFIRTSSDGANRFALTRNQLLSSAPVSRSPVVYQHGAIDLTAGIPAATVSYEDSLADLQLPPGPWHTKALWLVGRYQASDRIASAVNSFFPFRSASRGTGPLSVRKIWPLPLARHIARTPSPSLFLVHLMSPHSPYLYRPSGELRPMHEWAADRPDRRLSPSAYDAAYHRYCQQSEHLASELDAFLNSLSASGALDAMHIVIHGDHGSRIRRQLPSSLPRSSPESFDYSGPPPLPDLLDRFSILYATRRPNSPSANIVPAPHSLLRLLAGYLQRPPLAPGPSDDVYLFDPSGAPRPIPILNYWK